MRHVHLNHLGLPHQIGIELTSPGYAEALLVDSDGMFVTLYMNETTLRNLEAQARGAVQEADDRIKSACRHHVISKDNYICEQCGATEYEMLRG